MDIRYLATNGYDFYSVINEYTPVPVCEPEMSLQVHGALHVAAKEDKLRMAATPVEILKPIMTGKRECSFN